VLPSLDSDRLFAADGGLETTMIFDRGIELPCFASFLLLRDESGREALRRYYRDYIEIARRHRLGFVLDTPTWRASRDWGAQLGYSPEALAAVNRRAVGLAMEIREQEQEPETPFVICGTIGPRGDAYEPADEMGADEAQAYHSEQIATFADAGAEMVSAYTLPYSAEAIGIVRAAAAAAIPVTISFTVETDGRLPSGQPLGEAIEAVDAESDGACRYFMVNCAHPTHFAATVEAGGAWVRRLGGVRCNASRRSHAELDEADELDRGDPQELGALYKELKPHLPSVRVLGGCCGTGTPHIASIWDHWLAGTGSVPN
jgi:S-methylmethionine-dependent homocysteine/selenocysteine methylase